MSKKVAKKAGKKERGASGASHTHPMMRATTAGFDSPPPPAQQPPQPPPPSPQPSPAGVEDYDDRLTDRMLIDNVATNAAQRKASRTAALNIWRQEDIALFERIEGAEPGWGMNRRA